MTGRGLLLAAGLGVLSGCAAPGDGPRPGVEQVSVNAHGVSCTEQSGGYWSGARTGGTAIGIGVDANGNVTGQLAAGAPLAGSGETARCDTLLRLAEQRAEAELAKAQTELAQQRIELQIAQMRAKMEVAAIERGAAGLDDVAW